MMQCNLSRLDSIALADRFDAHFHYQSANACLLFLLLPFNECNTQIRLKNSNPENLILNGRAALCAGRDEMSSEEEEEVVIVEDKSYDGHKFSRPDDQFQFNLESGAIPDARLIHEARKRRQKAREQGELSDSSIVQSTFNIQLHFR